MREYLSQFDSVDRRQLLEWSARSMLGVSLLPALGSVVAAAPGKGGKAKRLIYLYMAGAMSHLDTFDLKPGHKNQGETRGIKTNVPGKQISQYLPTLATQFDQMVAIRSMHTETGAHEQGEYLMRTSYKQVATTRHPSMGPWIQKFRGRQNKALPDTVTISPPARHPAAGFFDPTFSPLPIGDPNRGLENTTPPAYLMKGSFDRRMTLINKFGKRFRDKYKVKKVQAYTDFYSQARTLQSSGLLKMFDLNEEKNAVRDRYGRDPFGQGCLLARRLIESKIPCVEVAVGGWDMHNGIFGAGAMPRRGGIMDQAVGNLLKDLKDRGLLDETLVVLTTEFGRTPVINQNAGRDHHPAAFSAMLAGGGIKGGQFYGSSDEAGVNVDEDGVAPADLNATIASALGLPLDKVVHSPTGRPFKVAHDGEPITKLF